MITLGRILNETRDRADDEVTQILEFAADRLGGLDQGQIAVKIKDGHGGGHAMGADNAPQWAHPNRYAVYLTIPLDEGGTDNDPYGHPRACWHAKAARDLADEAGAPTVYEAWALAYERGERRFGRWPIYIINDWREHLLHLAAHEFAHILAYDRERIRGRTSEVQCELFAERVLNEWRLEHTDPKEDATTTTAPPPAMTLAKMGHGITWHILAGHVTDDIMKTVCGLRATPQIVEHDIDARAVRHRGANVCANCHDQHVHNSKGGTTMPNDTLTETLQDRASEAAGAAENGDEAAGGKKTATATVDRDKASKRGGSRKAGKASSSDKNGGGKKLSAIKAAEEILRKEGKPLHVKELTQRILAMPNTRLGGKTPDATVGAILAVDSKKSGSAFRRTKPGTYTIRKGR